jgi:hypothetical protein
LKANAPDQELLLLAQGSIGFTKEVFLSVLTNEIYVVKLKKENLSGDCYKLAQYAGSKVSMGALQVTFKDDKGKASLLAIALSKASITEIQNEISNAYLNLSKALAAQISSEEKEVEALDKGTYIGGFTPESGVEFYERSSSKYGDRKLSKLFQSGGRTINVYSKVLECDGQYYILDHQVSADVVFDGQSQVSRRPTLTRMGLLSPLPGSALIAGFALAKKETHDNREVHVVIAHPKWSLSIRVKPKDLGQAKALATRINAIADSMSPSTNAQMDTPTDVSGNKLQKLQEIKSLLDSGFITQEESDRMKKEVLDN